MTKRTITRSSLVLFSALIVAIIGVSGAQRLFAAEKTTVPRFQADTSEVPELQPWGRAAEAICQAWYPQIVEALKSDDSENPLPTVIPILFKKDMKGVAHVSGAKMFIAADWIKGNPNDFGMVCHELTHLVQRYPRNRAGWLVEGIADYIRAKHFEPQIPLPKINFEKAKHTDSYKTTAAFLIWLEDNGQAGIVVKLNAALRAGKYDDSLFREITGKEVGQLWTDFAESQQVAKPES